MAELVISINGSQSQRVPLHKSLTTLGRRQDSDVVLTDLSVSGRHCVFESDGSSSLWIRDAGSTNGTFVNGDRIQRHQLQEHDVLAVGIYRIQYLSGVPDAEPARTAPLSLEELGAPGTSGALRARMQVLSGPSAGVEVPLVRTVTTFGTPGLAVVAVSHRRQGYYVMQMPGGQQTATLNGQPVGAEARLLADQDIVALTESRLLFVLG